MIPNDHLPTANKESGVICSAVDPQVDKNDEETENEFEDSCWDPYCETVEEMGMDESQFIGNLIDVNGCQTNNNNNKRLGELGTFEGVSLDIDFDHLSVIAGFRDDLLVDTQYGAKYQRAFLLRKTKSCPDTPLRSADND